MKDLIEALLIFQTYVDSKYPTSCEHEVLLIMHVGQNQASKEHKKRLEELGFFWNTEYDCWASYRYGSA